MRAGRPYLAAAWGFACGLGYASFFTHLQLLMHDFNAPDPAPIAQGWLTVIIGAGWALCILALVISLRPIPEDA